MLACVSVAGRLPSRTPLAQAWAVPREAAPDAERARAAGIVDKVADEAFDARAFDTKITLL
jgi:hypothetical protein